MFAFVLFDKQSKKMFHLFEIDSENQLNLYFTGIDNKYLMVFSSELKSIKKFLIIANLNISKIGIQNYKYSGYYSSTVFHFMKKLTKFYLHKL